MFEPLRRVIFWLYNNVSKEHAFYIFKVKFDYIIRYIFLCTTFPELARSVTSQEKAEQPRGAVILGEIRISISAPLVDLRKKRLQSKEEQNYVRIRNCYSNFLLILYVYTNS